MAVIGSEGSFDKLVAQAIPTYVMGVFKLPYRLYEEITQLIQKFWWGGGGGQRKMHWII
jgi:hypothetical protein